MGRRGLGVVVHTALLVAVACRGPAGDGASEITPTDTSLPTTSPSTLARGVVAEIEIGQGPCASVEAFGSLWVTTFQTGTIGRVDPAANEVIQTIEDEETLCGIVPAGDELWVAVVESQRIDRIDPESGEVLGRIPLDGKPFDLQTGHGSVWVASRGSGRVWRLDPRTAEVEAKIEVGSTELYGLLATRDAVWVADELEGLVVRIDASTNRVAARIQLDGPPFAFAPAGGGVWVTSGEGVLSRIDAQTNRVTARVPAGSEQSDPATLGGFVWVPDPIAGVVDVFDGGTGMLISTLRLGKTYLVAQAGFGDVWVADFSGTTIVRIDPSIVIDGSIP